MATQSVKDILNTDIPKPSFVLSPSVPAPLPTGVTHTRNGQNNVARTLDPYSGKFEQVEEDTPRVYGSDQTLLVEAPQRTNHVKHSADVNTNHFNTSGLNSTFSVPSIIANDGGSKSINTDSIYQLTGSFTSSRETASVIFENDFGGVVKIRIGGGSSQFNIAEATYDFSDGSFALGSFGAEVRGDVEVIDTNGPGVGGQVIRLYLTYDPTLTSDGGGSGRELYMFPAETEAKNIIHHAQLEEAGNASSPIVTDSSAKTRAADDYTIFEGGQPSWWNPNGGTFYLEVTPGGYDASATKMLETSSFGRWLEIKEPGQYEARVYDGNTILDAGASFTPLSKTKIAIASTGSEKRISANGNSNANSTNGTLVQTTRINLDGSTVTELVDKVVYYPRALPESTLNTLTT